MNCEIINSPNVSGTCPGCHNEMVTLHFVERADGSKLLRCTACCPIHGVQEFKEWEGAPKTLTAKQEGLF